MTHVPSVLVLASLIVGLAGCADDGAAPATVPPKDEEGRHVIRMTAENRFVPDHAIVPAGATVVWVVKGGVHDVTAANGSWSSNDERGTLRSADNYARSFHGAAVHEYVCDAHRFLGMTGIIEVR